MVKTRSQAAKNLPALAPLPPAHRRRAAARCRMGKSQLRSKLCLRLRGERRQLIKGRKIDFSSEEYISIANPQKFNCPICLELMIFPVLTHCGHAFCLPCLEEALTHKNSCSLCREALTYDQFRQSKTISEIIEKIARRMGGEGEEEFEDRRKAFLEEDRKRCIDKDLKVGDAVDFYMEGLWHEGEVVEIEGEEGQAVYEVKGTNKECLQTKLKQTSRLLAKHRFFSKQSTMFRHYMGQFRFERSMGPLTAFVPFHWIQDSFFDFEINQIILPSEPAGIDEIRFIISIQHS